MNATQETEKLRRLFVAREAGRGVEGSCPEPERVWEAALDRSPGHEFRELLDHTAVCPACASSWRLAREVGEKEARGTERPVESARPAVFSRGRLASLVAVAAVLVAAAGLFLVELRRGPVEAPVYRTTRTESIRSLLAEDVSIPRERCLLRWSSGVDGADYSLRVMDEDLNVLISAEHLLIPEYRVPEEALAGVTSGSTLLWQVDAVLPDGRRLRSATYPFRIE